MSEPKQPWEKPQLRSTPLGVAPAVLLAASCAPCARGALECMPMVGYCCCQPNPGECISNC